MSEPSESIFQKALELSVEERARLITVLIGSLDGPADAGAEVAWASEIEKRARAAIADPDGGEPALEVLSKIRAELGE